MKFLPILAGAAVLALAVPASADTIVCAGRLWKGMEIGHGIYQCTIASGSAAKKIFSVCSPGQRCTIRVDLTPRTDAEMENADNVVIMDKDRIISVKRGAADDSGAMDNQRNGTARRP